jgi:hypothetical protein
MKELPNLLQQRIKEFDEVKSVILEIDSQIKEAGKANLDQAGQKVASQSIMKIIQIVRAESLEAGEKIGYSKACTDLSNVLQAAIKRCNDAEQSLQLLLSEVDDLLAEENDEKAEDEISPLALREESEDLN